MKNRLFFTILFCSFLQFSCTAQPNPTRISGEGIGTYYNITISDKTNVTKSQIDSVIAIVNNSCSIFNPNSLVAKINRNETDSLDALLIYLIDMSLDVSAKTDGAFDCTVGAIVNLWGFGKDVKENEISPLQVEMTLESVGYKKIKVVGNRLEKENPNTQLNFNAIAKGVCVDMVSDFLKANGLQNFLVDIGGEMFVSGEKAPNRKWRVGIQKPTETATGEMAAEEVMELSNIGVATSGNYRNYKEENGKRFGHTLNPKTGYPELTNLLSATVLAKTCGLADAYATAFMVMGLEKSRDFAKKHPEIETYFIAEK